MIKTVRNIAIIIFLLNSCTNIIGNVKERELFLIEVPRKSYKLRIVHLPSNATIQSSVQVRELLPNNEEKVLYDYERYNIVDTAYIQNDTTLLIVLRDTISYLGNKPDTMLLTLKE